ncbi:hypothetical protein CU669_20275 [Paramagnetospirillum kuznetsovii]|uniref:Response regulatory domain-containing protein n=1 Tax=Paramagnetospirillum kuznetsovii TaxID=2053833 RepID=A0A364NSM7_9PROT|nr:response regulator [Paramagnetospirillum kuznetsovii]RAU20086.1 hypothetical protein CU669_20275 [Paramagnetospirillum kuznetsovii]
MSLNTSFLGKACMVVASDDSLCSLIATSLHQIGFADVLKSAILTEAIKFADSANYDLIVCAGTDIDEPLDMIRRIRMETPEGAVTGPMICVISHMDVGNLAMMRNSGANCVMTLPISTRTMLKNVNRALNEKRDFISNPTFRGPCRRNPTSDTYYGPLRRAADRQDGAPQSPSSSPLPAQAPRRPAAAGHSGVPGASPHRPRASADAGEDPNSQASIIFNGVSEIAARIEHLKEALHATDDERTRKVVRAEIMEAAERLVNLVALVDLNKALHRGQDNPLRQKIESMKALFIDILRQMSVGRLDAIIADMERYLYGKEIALGGSDLLQERLASVEEIVAVLGGRKADETMKRKLDSAWEGIGTLQKMETEKFELADLTRNKRSKHRVSRIHPPAEAMDGVASQNGVADLLRSRGDGAAKKS